MQPTNITLNPSLENKNDTELALKEMVAALSPLMQVEQSGLDIANTTTALKLLKWKVSLAFYGGYFH